MTTICKRVSTFSGKLRENYKFNAIPRGSVTAMSCPLGSTLPMHGRVYLLIFPTHHSQRLTKIHQLSNNIYYEHEALIIRECLTFFKIAYH